MKNFALIGSAGYVAPKHLQSIKATGNLLLAAVDKHDAVGILDSYFPDAAFFTEFERFDRHLEKLKRDGQKIDYLTVCSPNYLHDAHCRYGLRYGADVICEKPLVLNPWNVDALVEMEAETGRKVFTILQLRHHQSILDLKKYVDAHPNETFDIRLTYITSRGKWYHASWKGDNAKSGGISTNIGIHFFDMLIWVFGPVQALELHQRSHDREAGTLKLERANVQWFLSIAEQTLPEHIQQNGGRTYRALEIDGKSWQFSDGFTDLHTLSYQNILEGNGWGLVDARAGIDITYQIRNAPIIKATTLPHPATQLPLLPHPFERAPF